MRLIFIYDPGQHLKPKNGKPGAGRSLSFSTSCAVKTVHLCLFSRAFICVKYLWTALQETLIVVPAGEGKYRTGGAGAEGCCFSR